MMPRDEPPHPVPRRPAFGLPADGLLREGRSEERRARDICVYFRVSLAGVLLFLAGCGKPVVPVPRVVEDGRRVTEGESAAAVDSVTSESLSPPEFRGKQIYLRGASPSGDAITALMEDETEVPAAVLTCVNCHGPDGRGVPEGGVTPSLITWDALTKPYGAVHASGRRHPAYNEQLLVRAICMGLDPAGNQLHVAMPRYRLSQRDARDLIAYLQQLGKDQDPGLSDTAIRIGVILPPGGADADMSRAVRNVMAAFFAQLNTAGGIYNRRIELRFQELPDAPEQQLAAARAFVETERPFALAASFMAGTEAASASLANDLQIPSVGPLTSRPHVGPTPNRYVFYLFAGPSDQCRVLAAFIANRQAAVKPAAAIVVVDDVLPSDVRDALGQEFKSRGWPEAVEVVMPPERFDATKLAEELQAKGSELVFFLGSGRRVESLMRAGETLGYLPVVLLPDPLAAADLSELPNGFKDRLFLSFPTLRSDHTAEALAEYQALADRHGLEPRFLATQFAAVTSAKILVEGLKRSGGELTREKLIAAIESLAEFPTGFTPPVSFGPTRRIGVRGGHVVAIDPTMKGFVPVSRWIKVDSDRTVPRDVVAP